MKKICMTQQIICKEKKDSFHMNLVWKWPQIKPSPRCAGQWCVTGLPGVTSPTLHYLHTLPTPCHSTAWPVGGNWWYCRGLLNEQHFHLTCPWVYFIRWLLLIGAFWLYSTHLGSSWAGWHVSQITRGSSHLQPSTLLWLQKLHPGTPFFTRLFLLIYFRLVENNGF